MCALTHPMSHSLWNKTRNELLVPRLVIADTFTSRLIGLLDRSGLALDEGLLLTGCHQVHMFFMRFPIDVIFCAKDGRILHFEHLLKQWRISRAVKDGDHAIELAAGSIQRLKVSLDEQLEARSNTSPL